MQSSYFPRLDLSAGVSYSSGSQNLYDWVENWNGMEVKPGFDFLFTNRWIGKAYWAYHGYHEAPDAGVVQDIFAPRNFHANLVTISVRYMF